MTLGSLMLFAVVLFYLIMIHVATCILKFISCMVSSRDESYDVY